MPVLKKLLILSFLASLCWGCAEENLLEGYDGEYEITWMSIDNQPVIPDDTGLARGTVILVPINKDKNADAEFADEDALMSLSYFSPQEGRIIAWVGDDLRLRPGQQEGLRVSGKATVIGEELEFNFLVRGRFMFRPHPYEPGRRVRGMARKKRN